MIVTLLVIAQAEQAADLSATREPLASIEASFDTSLEAVGFTEPDGAKMVKDACTSGEMNPVFFLSKAWKLPKRETQFPDYIFVSGLEVVPAKKVSEWTDADWSVALEDLKNGICILSLSEFAEIFLPPYLIASQAIEVDAIDSKASDQRHEVVLTFKQGGLLKSLRCVSKTPVTFENVKVVLPEGMQLALTKDLTQLPKDADPKPSDFENPKKSGEKMTFDFSSGWDFSRYSDSKYPDLGKTLRDYSSQYREGFDRWGYYRGADIPLDDKTRLRVIIRQDDFFNRRWPMGEPWPRR